MKVAVVIPAYKVSNHLNQVLSEIGPEITHVFVVDDACPEGSGAVAARHFDKRISVLKHSENQGVGGAVVTGYRAALAAGVDIVVKLDGDGQMEPSLIPTLIEPILHGLADYTKGNRFDSLTGLRQMPGIRVFGNGGLSVMTKISTGYWNITDPTNGFTAIHSGALRLLDLDKLSKRYFFESDMLFQLSLIRALVSDVPMNAKYGDEKSNLRIGKVLVQFPIKHFINFHRRVFFNYYLRELTAASLELPIGIGLGLFGLSFGALEFSKSLEGGVAATVGTVMLAGVPLILGVQFVLAFLSADISSVPDRVRHKIH